MSIVIDGDGGSLSGFPDKFLKNGLGRCLSDQNIEIWLQTEKPKWSDFWQRHLALFYQTEKLYGKINHQSDRPGTGVWSNRDYILLSATGFPLTGIRE